MAEVTEQIVREAPEIEAIKLGLLKSAKQLADKRINLPGAQVAGFTGLQNLAFDALGNEAGIGGYLPYLTEAGYTLGDAQGQLSSVMGQAAPFQRDASNLFRSVARAVPGEVRGGQRAAAAGQAAVGQGIRSLEGASAEFDPSSIDKFMNPFETAAVQQALKDIRREGQIAAAGQAANAVGSGAFGGSREAVAQGQLQRNVFDQQGRTAAQMRQAGFESAAQRAQQAFEQARGRQLQSAGLMGQLGQTGANIGLAASDLGLRGQQLRSAQGAALADLGLQYGQLGLQAGDALSTLGLRQASLGELAQNQALRDIQSRYEFGKQQQAQQQAVLDADRQNRLSQLYEPYQRLSFLSDIYKGAPSSQQVIAGSTGPNVSPAQQFLGLGIAGLSAAAGAQKAGLFG
jgi:hypothetical protein